MLVLGVSALFHDSAAALLRDGEIVAAAQEERFSRRKNDDSWPIQAGRFCLRAGGVGLGDVDMIVFYENPFLRLARVLDSVGDVTGRDRGKYLERVLTPWSSKRGVDKLGWTYFVESLGGTEHDLQKIRFSRHHLSHAASAFFPSPFEAATVLVVDGVGERETTSVYRASGNTICEISTQEFPNSLGLIFSAFTDFLGFRVNSGEYKVMGLAPYGVPRFSEEISKTMLKIRSDGLLQVQSEYFDFLTAEVAVTSAFESLLHCRRRRPHEPLLSIHADVAASIQEVLSRSLSLQVSAAIGKTGVPDLCLAGGVALNCVANSKLRKLTNVERMWVQPAAGDAGGALGAAYVGHHLISGGKRKGIRADAMQLSMLGPQFSDEEIQSSLQGWSVKQTLLEEEELIADASLLLAEGRIIAWFQGRMEFGPRALGNRSILADPRRDNVKEIINRDVKRREPFRPFGASVLEEYLGDWFCDETPDSYMLFVKTFKERVDLGDRRGKLRFALNSDHIPTSLPGVTHVDGSCRVQTVAPTVNSRFRDLLLSFFKRTGVPILLNTSFNVRGESIVCTPEDALESFADLGVTDLFIGRSHVNREAIETFKRRKGRRVFNFSD